MSDYHSQWGCGCLAYAGILHLLYPRKGCDEITALIRYLFFVKMFVRPYRVKSNTAMKGSDRWDAAAAQHKLWCRQWFQVDLLCILLSMWWFIVRKLNIKSTWRMSTCDALIWLCNSKPWFWVSFGVIFTHRTISRVANNPRCMSGLLAKSTVYLLFPKTKQFQRYTAADAVNLCCKNKTAFWVILISCLFFSILFFFYWHLHRERFDS